MLQLWPADWGSFCALLSLLSPLFKELHGNLDNLLRCLHEDGAGQQVKHAEVITKQEQVQLWESGELGTKVYYNRKNFCLWGGVER